MAWRWPGNPLFVDPDNGDLRLSPGSPCIDAGGNTAVPVGITTDLDGNPRFVDDPATPDTGTCPDSNLSETVVIDGCDSGVANLLFEDGCTMADLIAECAEGAVNHEQSSAASPFSPPRRVPSRMKSYLRITT